MATGNLLPPSKIRGDTLVLPIAISGRLRTLLTPGFLGRRLGIRRRGLPSRFGFGERALGRRCQGLSFRYRCGRRWPCGIVGHRKNSSAQFNGLGIQMMSQL